MIASSRIDLLQSEAMFADAVVQLARGDDGPNAIAASRIIGETFLWWRLIVQSKIER